MAAAHSEPVIAGVPGTPASSAAEQARSHAAATCSTGPRARRRRRRTRRTAQGPATAATRITSASVPQTRLDGPPSDPESGETASEGSNGAGRPLAQRLLADGEQVVDVPAKLSARARLLDTGHNRKSDAHEAHAVAVVAVRNRRLRVLAYDADLEVLRMLIEHRDELRLRQRIALGTALDRARDGAVRHARRGVADGGLIRHGAAP